MFRSTSVLSSYTSFSWIPVSSGVAAALPVGLPTVASTPDDMTASRSVRSAEPEMILRRAHRARVAAVALYRAGRNAEAAAAAGAAAEGLGRLRQWPAQARVLRLQADALLAAGRPVEALKALKVAARSFASSDDTTLGDHAACEAALAATHRMIGSLDHAYRHLQSAADSFDEAGLPTRSAICRLNAAVVLHGQGEVGRAVQILGDVRAALVRSRRADAVAVCDFNLGVALHDLGELDDAVEHLQQARATFVSLARPHDVAACNQNLGVALLAMGRSDEALQCLRTGRGGFATLGHDRDAAQCDHNLAAVMRSLGDHADADRLESQAHSGDLAIAEVAPA